MKLNVKETQGMVNHFRKEINRNTGILLEEIVVKEADFEEMSLSRSNRTNFAMSTKKEAIYIDPNKRYNPKFVSLEYVVLHELGYRAQEVINPEMHLNIIENLTGFKLRNRSALLRPLAFAKMIF